MYENKLFLGTSRKTTLTTTSTSSTGIRAHSTTMNPTFASQAASDGEATDTNNGNVQTYRSFVEILFYLGILNLFNLFETIIDANVGLYIGVSVVLLISLIFVLLIIKKTAKSDKMKKSVEGMQFINGNNQKYIVK